MTVRYKGSTAIREVWNSGEITSTYGQRTRIIKYQGLYADLIAAEPLPGATLVGDTSYECTDVRTLPIKGKLGEQIVTYVKSTNLSTISELAGIQIDILWIKDEIPFTQSCYVPNTTIHNVIALIDSYLDETDDTKRTTILDQITALGAVALRLLRLISAGIRSYPIARPVVRKTQDTISRPSTGLGNGLFKREAPDVGTVTYPLSYKGPDGADEQWVYIRMDDSASRTGRGKMWKRTQEWHGLYLPASMNPDLRADILSMYPAS
jgi:hypothetical protein